MAGAFEFLVDHFIHLGACVDECSSENRQAAAFFDVSCRAKESLRPVQCVGIDTTRKHLARRRYDGVVSPRQSRDRVQQDNDVAFVFCQALGLLDDHFCDLHVTARRLIEG